MDEIEALLEDGKKAAAEKGSSRNGDDSKSERRDKSPSGRSHTSSRSHRRSHRDSDRTSRGDKSRRSRSRSRDSRRSSRRHRAADEDEDKRSPHSSSSKRANGDAADEDSDRKRRRRSRSSTRHEDGRAREDEDQSRRRSSGRRDEHTDGRDNRDRDDNRDVSRRDEYRGAGRRRREDSRERERLPRRSPHYEERQQEQRKRSPSPPKMTEEEHEMRSVFVSQLSARVGDRELFQFFETQVGKVRDARVILDRVSRRSKGVAYVEFFELDDVRKAINLTGTRLLSIPIIVQYTEAERNRQAGLSQRTDIPEHITIPPGSDARGDTPVPWNRIYVGSLPFSLRENDLRQIFEPFGPIDVVDLHFDNITQKSKGYCFVQYKKHSDAQQALDKMNGFEIAGRGIRVGLVTEKGSANPNSNSQYIPGNMGGGGGMGGPGGMGGMRTGGGMMRPDSLEEGGGSLNSISRIELMQKLARTEPASTGLSAPTKPMFRVNVPTATSKSVQLKNMFNPAEETERDWDTELRDDVKSECETKYGKVLEIYVEKDSAGEIYLKFDSIDSATKAVNGLNGRFFGGAQISAAYISDAMLEAHRK
ncbi:MAG: hypothetical protein CYPHOPRED_003032 [Cyphobasidiales sp. Tagirdzhanova-0007]|nr:MAG: hypothetical protein CYPHOPRED_003032 [Cyphobasidiales sp. Tagirdzhanova-0007]